MWQDAVFFAGSVLTAVALGPLLRNSSACVPLGTSVSTAALRAAYAAAFLSLGMTWSALGVALVSVLWGLVALYRRPRLSGVEERFENAESLSAPVPGSD